MRPAVWLAAAGGYGFLAVTLGAFGAHALKDRLDAAAAATYHTAVEYQFHHALALLAVSALAARRAERTLDLAGFAFASGVPLFCGSLYALAFGAPRILGAVAPLGGLLFLAGWASLFVSAWRALKAQTP